MSPVSDRRGCDVPQVSGLDPDVGPFRPGSQRARAAVGNAQPGMTPPRLAAFRRAAIEYQQLRAAVRPEA
jgi:hypothetical protein